MSRRTRPSLPLSQDLLQPKLVDDVMHTVKFKIQKAKMYYDRKAKDLSELEIGQPVRVNPKTQKRKGNMEPVWKTSSKDHKLMSTSGIDVTAETFAQQMKIMIHFPSKSAMLHSIHFLSIHPQYPHRHRKLRRIAYPHLRRYQRL